METDQLRVKNLALPLVIISGNNIRASEPFFAHMQIIRLVRISYRGSEQEWIYFAIWYINGPNGKRLPPIVHVHIDIGANCFAICRGRATCEWQWEHTYLRNSKFQHIFFHRKVSIYLCKWFAINFGRRLALQIYIHPNRTWIQWIRLNKIVTRRLGKC